MNLYNKYRPKKFKDVIGNEDTISYLKEVLNDHDKIPNAFLLHGQTGTGKTTVARIIVTMLKCAKEDFTELDTATFRGIDTVRWINKNSRFHTVRGGPRVYLVDEVHKMTNDAQNAMLKMLEEPPRNCFFILCTTEPNKLLPTIRSRCVGLQMLPLEDQDMAGLLELIVKKEGKKISKKVVRQILMDSLGLPRNAIQILEKVLPLSKKKQLKAATQAAAEVSASIELCRALIFEGSWHKVKGLLKGLKGQEAETIRRHVLGYAQSVLLNGENDSAAHVLEEFWEPLYDIGFPGLVYQCYSVIKG